MMIIDCVDDYGDNDRDDDDVDGEGDDDGDHYGNGPKELSLYAYEQC